MSQANGMEVGEYKSTEITITFEGKQVGRLFLKGGKLHFEGEVDKSAEIFFQAVCVQYLNLEAKDDEST